MNMKSLTRKWHGLPIWVWAGITAVMLFLLYRYFQGRNAGSTTSANPTAAQDAGTANANPTAAQDAGTAASSPAAGGSVGLPSPLDNTIPYNFYGGINDPYYTGPPLGDSTTNNQDLPNVTPDTSPSDSIAPPLISSGSPIYPTNTFTSLKPLGFSSTYKQLAPKLGKVKPKKSVAAGKVKPPGRRPDRVGAGRRDRPGRGVPSVAGTPKTLKVLPTDVSVAIQNPKTQAAKVRQTNPKTQAAKVRQTNTQKVPIKNAYKTGQKKTG